MDNLRTRLENLLNEYSAENGSNTPDFILAAFLIDSMHAFDEAVKWREHWYGRTLESAEIERGDDNAPSDSMPPNA